MSETDGEGFLEALRASDSMKFWGNKQPLCPHCGTEYNISRHDHWELYSDDDRHSATCGDCNREFFVITHTTHSFSTDEQDDLEEPPVPNPKVTEGGE